MDRRQFIEMMSAGIAAAGVSPLLNFPRSKSMVEIENKEERPNFLFIIADDLMYRTIHALNNGEIHTPHLDRLVARGCAFTHCFHQGSWDGAVCVPSRMMLNSGLSAFHVRSRLENVHLWGQTLGAAGYDTYICGKWHLDPTSLARSFKEMGPVAPGFLESTPEGGAAYNRPSPGNTWDPVDPDEKGHWLHTNLWLEETPDKIEHSSELYANSVIHHLTEKAAKRKTPFMIYLGFNAPHDPRQAPQEYLDMYPQDHIEIPPNYLPRHPFDQGDAKVRDEVLAPFPRTKEAVQLHRREYYAIITHMDHQIGRILDALEKSGKASNTYVIVTADHGLAVGEHGLMGKQNLYDCSTRMPLLISGPGITPGKRVDELVYQHSMFPTTCELAGVSIPGTVEFPSLAPLLKGHAEQGPEAIFCYYANLQRMVRTKKHKLIVYPNVSKIQLFDLEADPWEMHDLSEDVSMAEVKRDLARRLKEFQNELGDSMPLDHLI